VLVPPDSVRQNYTRIIGSGVTGTEGVMTFRLKATVTFSSRPDSTGAFSLCARPKETGGLRIEPEPCRVAGPRQRPSFRPAGRRSYRQNRHHGRTGAALRAFWAIIRCNWSISPARVVSCASKLSMRACICPTNMPSLVPPSGGGVLVGGVSGIVTTHRKPWAVFSLLPESVPARSRRRTVSVETPRCPAASEILTSIPNSLVVALLKRLVNDYACLGRFVGVPA